MRGFANPCPGATRLDDATRIEEVNPAAAVLRGSDRAAAARPDGPGARGHRPIATPDLIQWAPYLPKTRSGKIMRRILRKIAEGDYEHLGDVSTLADPRVVKDLVDRRVNR